MSESTAPVVILAPPCAAIAAPVVEPVLVVVAPSCLPLEAELSTEQQEPQQQVRYAVEQYDQRNCPICLEGYTPENPAVVYGCGHAYHLQCAEGWRMQSGEDVCCMCGAPIHGTDATSEPVVLNSAATPSSSPSKGGGAAKAVAGSEAAAAAAVSTTRVILPSSQSLDALMQHAVAAASASASTTSIHPRTDESGRGRRGRHNRTASGGGARNGGTSTRNVETDDEATPFSSSVVDVPRLGRHRRSAASNSASRRRAADSSPARPRTNDPSLGSDDTALLEENEQLTGFLRRLFCCCFPGAGRNPPVLVESVSPIDVADTPGRDRTENSTSLTSGRHVFPRNRTRRGTASLQYREDDDDGFVMVQTPSQSDVDDERMLDSAESASRRPHQLAHRWPE